ncbi:FGGY-family carbohydrate kinase [Fodinibius sediminis]|uniref:Sugar (Pentulose or hexulose) kinase n=1 Tax=Fodinibius sediminis TaxID=1214077 RepID=A0A521BP70_9BACT|nr:FGGY family carbohydrate kinase [Fodinibius sediminis]SMO48944.1 Sugar (pentulose or hexulose) kinase [Fodinibius sediminis]
MATPVTAVFDIGKTNKKFFLFDEDYSILQKQQTTLDQQEDEDGDPCEDLRQLEYWMLNKLEAACRDEEIDIRALNFSGYGASLVHLDKQGRAIPPLYSYLKHYPEQLLQQFYKKYGGRKAFVLQTASPPMGMLNSGLQLYWLKHERPEKFKRIDCTLHFPQYLSYLVSRKAVTEQTSIGCHTALWDYEKGGYHRWLEQEGMTKLLPPIRPVSTVNDVSTYGTEMEVGIGIHDSSAALAPYLFASDSSFMLISTGTWSITLNPFNKEPLTYEELQRDCLCYMDIHGNQVKAARLFLGSEYMHQTKKLSRHFGKEHRQNSVKLDPVLLNRLSKEASPPARLQLETAHTSGPFPTEGAGDWQVDQFASYKEGYHQLMLDLAAIQVESIKLAEGNTAVDKLIVAGGFSQNDFYVNLLASFLPNREVYTASLPHASALGAAMVMNERNGEWKKSIDWKALLGLERHKPLEELEVGHYTWEPPATNSK